MSSEESSGTEIVVSNLVRFPSENPVARQLRQLQGRKDAIESAIPALLGGIASLAGNPEAAHALQDRLDALISDLDMVENGIAALQPRAEAPYKSEMMAPGWAFVLEYSRNVELTAKKHFKLIRRREDFDDRRSALIERLVTRYYRFQAYIAGNDVRNVKALAVAWIQTQARAVNTAARKQVRWREVVSGMDPLQAPIGERTEAPLEWRPDGRLLRSEQARVAKEVVERLFDGASDNEKLAMLAHLEGVEIAEIETDTGLTSREYHRSIRKLRERALALCA